MRGTRRPGVGEHELRAVTDHPAPLQILARIEAGCVDERDDRKVERIAERHEPGRLLRCRDVERARQRDRLVRHDADRTSVDRRERGDDVRRPAVAQLEQAVLVDDGLGDLAHVVAAGRRRRDLSPRFGARPVGGIVARPAGRLGVGAVGEVVQQVLHRPDGRVAIGDDHRGHARVAGMRRRAAELVDVDADAGELLDHHRPVDERVAGLGHDREIGEPEQQGRPRDRWAVDHGDRRDPARTARQRGGRRVPTRPGPRCPRGCRRRRSTARGRRAGPRRARRSDRTRSWPTWPTTGAPSHRASRHRSR